MIIRNSTKRTLLASNCKTADHFFSRFLGLMGKRSLELGCGLLIAPCNSIHMFFMRFPLDIVFIDKNRTVVYLIESIPPWKFSKIIWKADSVIELPAGTIKASCTSSGDTLSFS